MSLLDRVQRKAEGAPAPSTPAAPAGPAPSPERTADVENDRYAPAGWQTRQGPGPAPAPQQQAPAPAPAPVRPVAPAPRPFEAERAAASEQQRAPSLLNRSNAASGLSRPGLSKMGGHTNTHVALRAKVHQRLVEELAQGTDSVPPETVRQRIAELLNDVITEQNITMSRPDRLRLVEILTNDVLGLGPLEELLASEDITEIMINSYKQIYVEQHGKLTLSPVTFESDQQLMQVIDRIVSSIGRRVDESSPMVDARLKDGSRVNVIIPPLALRGPTMTIRKFAKEALTIADLVKYGSITDDMVKFLRACVRGKLNVVVSGGTGSGKTTTLNILSSFIPEDERIVTIEDAAELQLRQDHVVTLETRPANVEGRGRVSIRDLVINSLRMRPDRIVVGECRGGEALDMLQAMNTGHDGSLTTLHANNAHDCISRLETLVLMAGAELPSRAIREQIGSAVNLVVQQSRLRDGTRKIVSITEVLGCNNNEVQLQDIFTYKQAGVDEDGKVVGSYMPTGVLPTFLEHLTTSGEEISEEIFQPMHVMDGVGSA
jgi:pilus assembly protein CpaF